jgi:hypothetical protein
LGNDGILDLITDPMFSSPSKTSSFLYALTETTKIIKAEIIISVCGFQIFKKDQLLPRG